jgi:hypothetical protein
MTVHRDYVAALMLEAEDALHGDGTREEILDRIPSDALIDLLVERGALTRSSLSRARQAYWAAPRADEVTHHGPSNGASTTECCGAWATELPPTDRFTYDAGLVTCTGKA